MTYRVAVIAGDGAGPEVVAEARKAVDALGLDLTWHELPWGTDHYRTACCQLICFTFRSVIHSDLMTGSQYVVPLIRNRTCTCT